MMEGQCFVLTGIDTMDMDFPSLHEMFPPKLSSMDL